MHHTTDHRALLQQLRRRLVRSGTLSGRLSGWEGVIEVAGHTGVWMLAAARDALSLVAAPAAGEASLRVFGDPLVLHAVLSGHLSVADARISRQLEVDGDPDAIAVLERLVAPDPHSEDHQTLGPLLACASI